MKIFIDKQDYPHSKHLCSTDPCSIFQIYTNAIFLDVPPLFSFKFATTPKLSFKPKSQSRTKKFIRNLEKKNKRR
jgi:hypothetical protein